ncbi:MAG: prepilin peptidase [Geminicoccaceae bacterium]
MTVEALIVITISPFVGSFIGVVIDRLPQGRPIVFGRSSCDHCGQALGWTDLIPLVSFVWFRGRCRHCKTKLRIFYLLIELAAIVVALSAILTLSGWLLYFSVALGWSLLALAVIDHHHLILPDALTLPLIPAGLIVTSLIEPGLLGIHMIGVAAGLFVFLTIAWSYRCLRGREGLGVGDAKLLAGAGAWLGWPALPGVVLLASISALGLAVLHGRFGERMTATSELAFGSHLALAFWASWLLGPLTLA